MSGCTHMATVSVKGLIYNTSVVIHLLGFTFQIRHDVIRWKVVPGSVHRSTNVDYDDDVDGRRCRPGVPRLLPCIIVLRQRWSGSVQCPTDMQLTAARAEVLPATGTSTRLTPHLLWGI